MRITVGNKKTTTFVLTLFSQNLEINVKFLNNQVFGFYFFLLQIFFVL